MPMLWLYAFLHVAYGSPQYQDTVFLVLSLNQMSETASLPGMDSPCTHRSIPSVPYGVFQCLESSSQGIHGS